MTSTTFLGHPKPWARSLVEILVLSLRFGVALAKVRTKFEKKIRRKAFVFLRKALKCKEQYNTKKRINRAWVAGADLQPVFDFLTSQWIGHKELSYSGGICHAKTHAYHRMIVTKPVWLHMWSLHLHSWPNAGHAGGNKSTRGVWFRPSPTSFNIGCCRYRIWWSETSILIQVSSPWMGKQLCLCGYWGSKKTRYAWDSGQCSNIVLSWRHRFEAIVATVEIACSLWM